MSTDLKTNNNNAHVPVGSYPVQASDKRVFTEFKVTTLKTNTISEVTSGSGVTIDGVLLKDGVIAGTGLKLGAPVVMTAGSYAITAANSGKLHIIPDTTAITATLPAAAAGLNYEFWYGGATAEAADHVIQGAAGTALFKGGVLHVDTDDTSAGVYADGSDDIIFTLKVVECGTLVKVWSDGTVWYITGTVYSATVPTFA